MTKKEATQLDKLENKVDLLFSLISNDHLAKQALQVHQAISAEVEKNPDNEQLTGVVQKAFDAYKFHAESINDSIKYYAQIHGEDSQKALEAFMATITPAEPEDEAKSA